MIIQASIHLAFANQIMLKIFSIPNISNIHKTTILSSSYHASSVEISQATTVKSAKNIPSQLLHASQCFNVKNILELDRKNKTGKFRVTVTNCVFANNNLIVGQKVPDQKHTRYFFHLTSKGYEKKNKLSAMFTFFTKRPPVVIVINDEYVDPTFNEKQCTYTHAATGTDIKQITMANSLTDCQPIR